MCIKMLQTDLVPSLPPSLPPSRYMYDLFDPYSVSLYMNKPTKRIYDLQCMLYKTVMDGGLIGKRMGERGEGRMEGWSALRLSVCCLS